MADKLTIRNCRFAYKCSAKWEDLQETGDEFIRFCDDCEKEVYFECLLAFSFNFFKKTVLSIFKKDKIS
jgi:hypothetical protein